MFLRSLRSALATALSEVHGAGDTLLLRDVAVAGLSGGDGDGMVSPGMGLRGGDEGAAEDVGGELLGAVARAAEMGARRVGIAMREARKEVEGLLKERR